jgi:small basic protein
MLLAALDSIFGAFKALLNRNYENRVFLSGLLANTVVAGGLTFLGDKLGVELYFAAIVAFGVRIFDNIAVIRRHLL